MFTFYERNPNVCYTLKIPLINPDLPRMDQVKDSFDEILKSGKITNFGKFVRDFEAKTHEYLGVETVSSHPVRSASFWDCRRWDFSPERK